MDDSKQSDPSATHSPLQAAAREYCGYGWRVIPVRGKAPCGGNGWPSKATSDAGEALALLEETKGDGVGVGVLLRQSGIIDLDADSPEAEQAIQTLFGGQVPQTPTFRSARGLHRLFQWRGGWQSLATKAKVMAGPIEIRGIGEKAAQTVFPPSGGRQWIVSPADCPLAVLDDSIVNELVRMASKAVKAAASTTLAPVDPIATGGRLDVRRWLDRVGAVLLEVDRTTDGTKKWFVQCPGFDRHTTGNGSKDCVITQELSGRMGGCCFHSSCGMGNWQALSHALGRPTADEWGYNESDLHWAAIAERLMAGDAGDVAHCDNQNAIVEAGIPASTNHPAIVGAQNHAATTLADQDDEQTSILPPDETNNLPDELLYPPGFLGEFVRHANDVAYVKQPELALGAAIATLATLIGHKIKDSTGTWSNIYVLALAPSGAGKEMPRDVLKAILQEAAPHLLGADVPASDAAILTGLRTSGSQVLTLDEAGDLFAHMQGRGGGALHMQKIKSVLKTIFTASKTSFKQTYKESKESFEILHPNLSVFATSTPESFWCHGVSHGDVEGGLIGRFLIFDGRVPRTPPMQPDEKPLPEKLIDIAKQWNSYLSIDNMLAPNPRSVTLTDEARRMKKEFSDWNFYTNGDGAHKPQDMTKKTIWRRAAEKVAKLALIHAASRAESPEKVEVDIIDVEWSIAVVKWSITTLLDGAERYMADGAYETNKKKMFRAIEDAGPRGLTGAELAKKGQWLEPRIRLTVLNDLKATGEVVIEEAKPSGRGRPGVFYIAARYRICSKKGRD